MDTATYTPSTGLSTVNPAVALPSGPVMPPAAVSRILAQFQRDQLAGFIEVAIGLLDVADGDSDTEANGDELDGNPAEDEFAQMVSDGPGCPISDPAGQCDEDGINTGSGQRMPVDTGSGCVLSDDDFGFRLSRSRVSLAN